MAGSYNRTVLVGDLTRDPEIKYVADGGKAVTKFSIRDFVRRLPYVEVTGRRGRLALNFGCAARFSLSGAHACATASIAKPALTVRR